MADRLRTQKPQDSDTCLIYAQDSAYGFLLLYEAREPTAHQLSKMASKEDAEFMNDLAEAAAAFIQNGSNLL